VELVDVGRTKVAINRNDHGETDGGFSSGNGDGENRDHHAERLRGFWSKPPKRNEVDVRGGEHHLDSDQNENGVATAERRKQADGKKRRRNDEQDRQRHSRFSSKTRMSAPMSAVVSKTPTHINGQT